jgi:hypothetical protein
VRFGIGHRRAARLSRVAADRLLDGGPGPEPLRHILTVAAGPGRYEELRGEDAARLAFIASARAGTAPDPRGRCSQATARTLTRIMAAKAITAIALTVGAGSVAVAATTDSFGDRPFGASSVARSEPDATDARRTLVADRTSDRAAEPPPAVDPHRSAGSAGLPGSCQGAADDRCAAATTTIPPSPPSRQPVAPVANPPADVPSSSNHSANRRPSAPDKNQRAGNATTNDATPKKQPPGQAAKEADQVGDKSKPKKASED